MAKHIDNKEFRKYRINNFLNPNKTNKKHE
jgi:hypothetical protein